MQPYIFIAKQVKVRYSRLLNERPFIFCFRPALRQAPGALKTTSFKVPSISFTSMKVIVNF